VVQTGTKRECCTGENPWAMSSKGNTKLGFNNSWKKKFCAVHYVFCEHSRETKTGLKIEQFKKSGVKLHCSTKGQETDFCFKLSRVKNSTHNAFRLGDFSKKLK